jgi:hypothetical protein
MSTFYSNNVGLITGGCLSTLDVLIKVFSETGFWKERIRRRKKENRKSKADLKLVRHGLYQQHFIDHLLRTLAKVNPAEKGEKMSSKDQLW